MDKCPHGGNHPAEHDATASSSIPAVPSDAITVLADAVAGAMEARHSELQLQLERALEKIDAVTEDNKTMGDQIELAHAKIFELTESNKELERVAGKQARKIECLETEVWSSTDWHSSDPRWTPGSIQ